MEAFSALLAVYAGNSSVTGEFPSQRASNADLYVSLMWVRISCQTNNRMTGDLRLDDEQLSYRPVAYFTKELNPTSSS